MLILFDIDDTLLDDAGAQRVAAAALHAKLGAEVDRGEFLHLWEAASERHYARYLAGELDFQGQRRARIREVVDEAVGDAAADELFNSYLEAYQVAWTLCPDASPCLEVLAARHRLGVVSNGDGSQQRHKLAALGIVDYFAHVVVSGDIGYRKPAPAIFQRACEAFGTAPRAAAYVGDRYEIDALGARSAGLAGIWLDRLGARSDHHLPPVISSLDELPEALEASTASRSGGRDV